MSGPTYNILTFPNLITITKKIRSIEMGYSGTKLVSGVSLLAAASNRGGGGLYKTIRHEYQCLRISRASFKINTIT